MDIPLMGCPLTVFQGGQILLPSTECVVSTGDPREHLGCPGCSLGGTASQFPPCIMTNQTYSPSGKGMGDLSPRTHIFSPQFLLELSLGVRS